MVWAPVPKTVHDEFQYLHSSLAEECPRLNKAGKSYDIVINHEAALCHKNVLNSDVTWKCSMECHASLVHALQLTTTTVSTVIQHVD